MLNDNETSPKYVRTSLAAAMTLGLRDGLFLRDAELYCINLLLTYTSPCAGNCAYCGLNHTRSTGETKNAVANRTFIRVDWLTFETELLAERTASLREKKHIRRVCISMLTHKNVCADTLTVCNIFRKHTDLPISVLAAPMVSTKDDLHALKRVGVDKIGVSFDAATEDIFEKVRGSQRKAPHNWQKYWQFFNDAVEVFGVGNVGSHFIVGLGETERELVRAFIKTRELGGETHLFSFFPERGTDMENDVPPPMKSYRRVQLARFLIDSDVLRERDFSFDEHGRITDFGLPRAKLAEFVENGESFRTSGCRGTDNTVACNRPFGNSRPGDELRNFPFSPNAEDICTIKTELEEFL